jgi:diguanylate cyclase (GGDEF)-like protein
VADLALDPSEPVKGVSLARVARRGGGLISLALAALFVLQVVAAVLLLARYAPDQARYTKAVAAANLAQAGMLDQETALRAFLTARDQTFLDSYSVGQKEVADGNLQLASLLGGDKSLANDLADVATAQQSWISGWAFPALSGADVAVGASIPAFLIRGKLLFDNYREEEAALRTEIAARQAASANEQNNVLTITRVVGLVLVAAVLAFGATLLRRVQREVADPVGRMTAQLDELVAGNYDSRVKEAGRVLEFAPISARLDQLAQTLAALSAANAERDRIKLAQAARLRLLLELTRDIAGSLSLRYILRSVGQSALKVAAYETAVVWLVDEDRSNLVPAFLSSGPDGEPMGLDPLEMGASLPGLAAKYGQAFRRGAPEDPPAGFQPERMISAIAVPMIVGARCIGVIELASTRAGIDAEPDIPVVETLAIHAGSAIEAARLHGQSEEMAQVDALTRLFNRRRLDEDLDQEVARAVRYERPMALVMLDTDHFKQFNDDLGHQRGDQILQEVAAILKEGLRTSDTAYRYGGEEFAMILRESSAADAAQAAERLRGRIEQRFGGPGNAANVTASFGVAALGPGVETAADLVRLADSALYMAKEAGRNRVVTASDERERPALRPVV